MIPFTKVHGTGNDFVLVPDLDDRLTLDAAFVRAVCAPHTGLGADGVIRLGAARLPSADVFMDYRNADGSLSEMCGNGVRVLGRYLALHEDADVRRPLPVATRAGTKELVFEGGDPEAEITVDMGVPRVSDRTTVVADGERMDAVHVDMGNPHAVAFVDDLAQAGHLLDPPAYDAEVYPQGVNVEFVVRRGDRHVAMRVHERGSGETRSCGTGACAVMVAAAAADAAPQGTTYRVDLPGGTLRIEWTADDRVLMTGPAVLVAEGNWLARR